MVTSLTQAEKELVVTQTDVSDFQYTSCYCEENVYNLCEALSEQGLAATDASDLLVVFISNPAKQVPFWQQRNSSRPNGFCLWDYHVICIQKSGSKSDGTLVWDLDSSLSLPVVLSEYVTRALRPEVPLDGKFRRLFRLIKAQLFLRYFASDRRHMKNREGLWLASPPPYNCIVAKDGEIHNLPQYNTILDEEVLSNREIALGKLQTEKFGIVVSQGGLLELFAG